MRGLIGAGNVLKLAGESISFAYSSFARNRTRGILSLLGVGIGIFCITAAMTVVDSLEKSLRDSLSSFGGNAIFVEKIPLEPDLNEDGVFKWWNYLGRPEPRYEEYLFLKERLSERAAVAFSAIFEDGKVAAVSENWDICIKNALAEGRAFTARELSSGAAVAIVGHNVAEADSSETIYVAGKAVRVIGRFEMGGIGAVDMYDTDNAIVLPYKWAEKSEGLKSGKRTITVMPQEDDEDDKLLAEIEASLRAHRRLRPDMPSDFSLNRLSFVMEEMARLFDILSTIAWIIGLFSLLVGGFGVANIMFVAVKERTGEIGLQKAVGANNGTIMFQYLAESAVISLTGGVAGLLLVYLMCAVVSQEAAFQLKMSSATILTSLLTTLAIGILSGLAPARSASRLPPAIALNKK